MCMEPYPGYEGKYFSMPRRNVVPKPVQPPHPPLWVACSNRDTIKLAARSASARSRSPSSIPAEAKYWVDEYYETFKNECTPIGRAVNPNIAMVTGFMCHEDSETRRRAGPRGLQVLRLRAGALLHHRHARARPYEHLGGLQERRRRSRPCPYGGIGNPDEVRANLETFEDVGVDQTIFIQQGGNNRHEDICSSLELFADRVHAGVQGAPRRARSAQEPRSSRRTSRRRWRRIPPLEHAAKVEPIESYPGAHERGSASTSAQLPKRRHMGPALDQIERSAGTRRPTIAVPRTSRPRSRPRCGAGICLTFRAADR